MTKKLELFKVEKYVTSRLWYTASAILNLNTGDHNQTNSDCSEQLCQFIESSLVTTENEEDNWIIYNIFMLLSQDNKTIKEKLDSIQFFTNLRLINTHIPKKIKKELDDLFGAIQHAQKKKEFLSHKISSVTVQYLETNILNKPAITSYLINDWMYRQSNSSHSSNLILQNFYINFLKNLQKNEMLNRNLGTLLSIISTSYITASETDDLISWLLLCLSTMSNSDEIELSLYSRSGGNLLKKWHKSVDNLNYRLISVDDMEKALNISKILFLTNDKKLNQPYPQPKELTLRAVRRQLHWFLDILDIGSILVKNGEYDKITRLLSSPILRNLWPLILLHFMHGLLYKNTSIEEETYKKSASYCGSIKFLLDKCHSIQFENNEPLLFIISSTLSNNIKFIEWIIEYRKKAFTTDQTLNINSISVRQLLNSLQNFCILTVLKESIDLHECSFDEMKAFLKDEGEILEVYKAYHCMKLALKSIFTNELSEIQNKSIINNYYIEFESILNTINPIMLRLEVIGNVFSMLFLLYNDHFKKEYDQSKFQSNEFNSNKQYDFICDKYSVKRLLCCLKKCIVQVGIDFAKLRRETKNTDYLEDIQKKIYAINDALTDAYWRLELLTSQNFMENDDEKKVAVSVFPSDFDFTIEKKLCFSQYQKNKSIFYNKHIDTFIQERGLEEKSDLEISLNSLKSNSTFTSEVDSKYIINLMLSSKESLVLQCLWKADYLRAQQVLEMFKMKNTELDGHFRFSKAMRNFRLKISEQMSFTDGESPRKKSKELQIFENFRRVVQGGYQNSRVAHLFETFVSSQESIASSLSCDTQETRDFITISVIDFALTINQDHQTSISLLDAAEKYLKLSRLDGTVHSLHFNEVFRLLHEGTIAKSVPQLLCDATVPLKFQDWKEKMDFWNRLLLKTENFFTTQLPSEKLDIKNSQIESTDIVGQKLFFEVISHCGNSKNYLHKILHHLKILNSIVSDDPNYNKVASAFLSKSINYYFGHQIFELNNEPENLEAVANKLGVSLVHKILVNCCPMLTYHDLLFSSKSKMWENNDFEKNLSSTIDIGYASQDPNEFVANTLSEVLLAVKHLYPNYKRILNKDLYNLIKDTELQKILSKVTELNSLDLSKLSVGDHTLAFFLNLWNLLFLYSQLNIWVNDPPLTSLKKYISLSSIYYHIGDLGFVSLATLRTKLLGPMTWDKEFFSGNEDLNKDAWQDLEFTHDPRVIFAMINEFYETPAIRIYYTQTLNKDLNQGLYDYLENYSTKDSDSTNNESKKTVYLPQIVQNYEENIEIGVFNLNCSSVTINNLHQNIFSDKIIRKYEPVSISYDILVKYSKNDTANVDLTSKDIINSDYHSTLWDPASLNSNVLHYLERHCWILSYLVKRVTTKDSLNVEDRCDNLQKTACIENISISSWIAALASALFNGNTILASVQENMPAYNLWKYFEECLANNQTLACINVLHALPTKLFQKTKMQYLRDKVLCQLIYDWDKNSNADILLEYIYRIKNINILAQAVLFNFKNWPVDLSLKALFHALHRDDKDKLPPYCRLKMNETLHKITVFYKILPYIQIKELDPKEATCQDVLHLTKKSDPVHIIKSLIDANKFELCHGWLEYHAYTSNVKSLVTPDLLVGLLRSNEKDFKSVRKLLSTFSTKQSIKLCKKAMEKLESISSMRFVNDYLLEKCDTLKASIYYKTHISLDILSDLKPKDRIKYVHLVKEPLLMLEQLLMNCKFESLRKILANLHRSDNLIKAKISMENFDKIVRFYAGKSLDFRVCFQRDGLDGKIKDSINPITTSDENRSNQFIMPENVPSREEWIPNDKARECSCCKSVIFSMFNRRHHCRRCGRVICAACSQNRMQIPSYPKSVLLRVCDDCKTQMTQIQMAQIAPSCASSVALECWKLTIDEKHNQTVREEFSFEYAPNISLCLAILSLHSDHKAYASFILDKCDEMKKLLQPGIGGRANPEVDHVLIIKMIKTLLVAVKVKCAKLGLNAGLAHSDRFLSQVDLIATLVQSDCLALIPSDDSLGEHALRKLRDLLTEKEQWTLALDVSTKSGLETQGVWAAWGKACLKAGHLNRARTKFSHCLEKVLYENFDDWVLVSFPDSDYSQKNIEDFTSTPKQRKFDISNDSFNFKRQIRKTRPIKDPPLLFEILQILENQSQLNPDNLPNLSQSKVNAAQEILATLNTLKAVSQNQYSLVQNWNSRSIYYEESLYYLLAYGSFNSILEFFIKYEEFDKCLTFVLENNVEPDLFFNAVFLRCVNMGNIEKLLEKMKSKDVSLSIWKKYFAYTCHSLDKKQFVHTLYHLQLFMKDYIRAAMMCIHFYTMSSDDYVDLYSNSHFLFEAQKHLETELNIENINKNRKKSVTSIGSLHSGITMEMEPSEIDKHLNTISRQLEIAKFLSSAEKEGRSINRYIKHMIDMDTDTTNSNELPTLFGNQQQKTRLAVLAILCGRDVEEGFGIGYRIIQDYNLRPQKVYSLAGHILALEKKIVFIEQLIKCCRSSGAPDSQYISDRVLTHCVKVLLQNTQIEVNPELKDCVDSLIRLINDVGLKISSYIESKQLKAAYLLAVKHQRAQDIRKILKDADRLGQSSVRSICEKWLKQTQNSV